MAAIVQHLEGRYGVDEIRNYWFFEVWNEASWMYTLGDAGYNQLYSYTVKGLLAGDAQVKVGGPAESAGGSRWMVSSLVSYAKSNALNLDFVSWHRYGNDDAATGTGYADANGMLTFFETMGSTIASSNFTGLNINDEWASCYDSNVVRDSEVSASFIAKTVHLIGTDTKYPPPFMFGWWTLSDLYEEFNTGTNTAYRERNFGLLLKGDANIPASFDVAKPAFNAFRLLHMMGDVRVTTTGGTTADGVNAVATVSSDNSAVQIVVYNHVNGGTANSANSKLVKLTVNNIPLTGAIRVKHYFLDRTHSNSYQTWVSQGKPAKPSATQWAQLSSSAELCYYSTATTGTSWTITYPQNIYGVSLIILSH
jgi:xylan 1,4-beta-xylosidase